MSTAIQTRGFLMVLGAAILFSIKAVLVKLGYQQQLQATTLMTLRMLFSLPVYLLILFFSHQRQTTTSRFDFKLACQVTALGIVSYYFASWLDLVGLQYISANLERLIIYLYPTLVLLLGVAFKGEKLSRHSCICLLVAYSGIALVFTTDLNANTSKQTIEVLGYAVSSLIYGSALTFAAALCFASYICFSENAIKQLGSIRFTCYAMLAASVAVLSHYLLHYPLSGLLVSTQAYYLVAAIALFSTILPSFLLSAGIRIVGSAKAGIIGTIGPVATLLGAYFVLGEAIYPAHIAGMVLVITSLIFLSRKA